MSNEHHTVKGQSATGPSHNRKQGQGQTLPHAHKAAKAESEHAEKRSTTKSQPQLGSKKRQPKSRSKTDSVCKQPKQRPKKKIAVSQKKEEEAVAEQDSEEEITEDFAENTAEEKIGKRHQKKKIYQSKKPSQHCLFDNYFSIHNDKPRRKFTGFLSDQLLQSEEVGRNSNVGPNDSLHTLLSDTPSCSLSNELTCRNELTPWHLCGHPKAHEALRVKSETRTAENSKLSSSSMHIRRSDAQCREKLISTPKKGSQLQLSCGKLFFKKGQQLVSGKKISTHIATDFVDTNRRGLSSPEAAAYYHRRRTFPVCKHTPYILSTQSLVKNLAASPLQRTRAFKLKSNFQPSLLYTRLLRIVNHSSLQHKSEPSEACTATECHKQHQDSTPTVSLANSHPATDLSRGQCEILPPKNKVGENRSAGGPNHSTFPEDSESKEQHSIGKDASVVNEEFAQSKEPTNPSSDTPPSSSSSVMSSAETSTTDRKEDNLCSTNTSNTSSSSRTCSGHEETGKKPSLRNSSDSILDNLETSSHFHEVKTDDCKRKSRSSVQNKTQEPLGAKNLATNTSGMHRHSRGVSESTECMKLEAAAAVSLKPSLAMNKHEEKSDTHLTKTTSSRNRKWPKRSQHGDGKETKRTLSEIFRQLREKGCLVNNCQKCSQQSSSVGKPQAVGNLHQTSSLHRTSKGPKQTLLDPSPGEGHRRRNGNKAKHRRVATSNAAGSKADHGNKHAHRQKSQSLDETMCDHQSSINESHFETNHQKIQSEIRSYLNMQKAIESKRSMFISNSVTEFKEKNEKERRLPHCLIRRDPKSRHQDCSDHEGEPHPESSLKGLSLCQKDRAERLQDTTHVIISKHNNSNQLNTTAQQDCSGENPEDGQRSNVTEDSFITIRPPSRSVNVPPPPPNSPILQSMAKPVANVKKKGSAYRLKEKCTRAEKPMQLAKVELHENLHLGCVVNALACVKGTSSSQSCKQRTPVVNKAPQKLNDYLLSRILHAKARTFLDKSRAAAGDKASRSSSRSLYHPCTTKPAKKPASTRGPCAPVLLFSPIHKKTAKPAKARQQKGTAPLSVLPLGNAPVQSSSTSSGEIDETESVTDATDEKTTGLLSLACGSASSFMPCTYSTSRAISSIHPELTERCESDYQLLRTVKPAYGDKSKLRR